MNEQRQPPSLTRYFREAETWSRSREDALVASRRIAWIVAIAGGTIAVLEAFALMLMMPLKRVEPYTLLVDRNTGYVQALKPLDAQTITPTAALTQSMLVQYVIGRESFDIDEVQGNFRKVSLWTAGPARNDYVASMQASNPSSPLARLPRTTTIETRVKSVTLMTNGTALVRFDTVRRDAGGAMQPAQPWVAFVKFQYVDAAMSASDRFVNPLGFQVTRYRRDAEALQPAETTTTVESTTTVVTPPATVVVPVPVPGATPTAAPPRSTGASPLAQPLPRARRTPEPQL